eukprot:scaffold1421_cov293-Prasinococcus_capsulatus_cf.AAC.6
MGVPTVPTCGSAPRGASHRHATGACVIRRRKILAGEGGGGAAAERHLGGWVGGRGCVQRRAGGGAVRRTLARAPLACDARRCSGGARGTRTRPPCVAARSLQAEPVALATGAKRRPSYVTTMACAASTPESQKAFEGNPMPVSKYVAGPDGFVPKHATLRTDGFYFADFQVRRGPDGGRMRARSRNPAATAGWASAGC